MSLKKIIEQIKKYKAFLITTHINPEADGIGAELAFFSLLKKLGKSGCIINESKVPFECEFLPEIKAIQPISKKRNYFDCAVFLDCSEGTRAGKVAGLIPQGTPTLNIDHHISNTYFAQVNWVQRKACSASLMVYQLCKSIKVPIDTDMAMMLYAGIVVDTGCFRYNNSSPSSHLAAADLLKRGVSPAMVYNRLFENNPFEDMCLLGQLMSKICRDAYGKIVWVEASRRILQGKFPSIDLAEICLGLLRSIKGVELAMVFKEVKGAKRQVRINFRSQNNFDCNYLASQFGGGGHKNASGATIQGDFELVKNKVIRRAKELMKEYA